MILFTADWHIKLRTKECTDAWACQDIRCSLNKCRKLVDNHEVDLHIIGGDLFDRVPSMDELTLYFDFVKRHK